MRSLLIAAGFLFLLVLPRSATATGGGLAPNLLIDLCARIGDAVATANKDAPKGLHAAVPIPPEINPPCVLCDSSPAGKQKAAAETAAVDSEVNEFVKESESPEADDITRLLSIEREIEVSNFAGYPEMLDGVSANVKRCILDGSGKIDDSLQRLATRLVHDKADAMADTYGKDWRRALPGIKLLLSISKAVSLLSTMVPAEAGAPEDLLERSKIWQQTLLDEAEKVRQNYNYNLCPVYLEIVRSVQLMGGAEPSADLADTVQKMNDLLHFDITMDLRSKGKDTSGASFDVSWQIKSTMRISLPSGTCYTPELENGNDLAVTVQNFKMIAKDGTEAQLQSSRQFTTPIASVTLGLCDHNPQLAFHISDYGPSETVEVAGRSGKAGMFELAWSSAVNSPLENAVANGAGGSPSSGDSNSPGSSEDSNSGGPNGGVPLRTPKPKPTPNAAIKAKLDKLKAELQSHKTDIAWLMGPQGQADIAQMQSLAAQQAQASEDSAGPGVAAALSKTGILELTWTNGVRKVVDQDLKFEKNGFTDTLHVTVELHS